MNLHHRDGKPWDPARYNPDNSDTWKCNGLGADCGYSHTGTVSYHYDRGRHECNLHGPVETVGPMGDAGAYLYSCRHCGAKLVSGL